MKEYIERAAVEEMLENAQLISDGEYCGYCTEDVNLGSIPAADVAPVRHGRWVAVRRTNASTAYQCSVCERKVSVMNIGAAVWDHYPYCHCGAKMDADE